MKQETTRIRHWMNSVEEVENIHPVLETKKRLTMDKTQEGITDAVGLTSPILLVLTQISTGWLALWTLMRQLNYLLVLTRKDERKQKLARTHWPIN